MKQRDDLPAAGSNDEPRRSVVGLPAQRERTIRILSDCFAGNLLEMDEFERRIAQAHQARSVQELARLIDDIPGEMLESAKSEQRKPASPSITLREDEQPVHGIMMSRTLRGRWLKCRTVSSKVLMSNLELDFRDLDLQEQIVEVNVLALMSSIVITVPQDLPVQVEVVPVLGEVKESRRVNTSIAGRGPGVRLTGFAVMGEVKVRVR